MDSTIKEEAGGDIEIKEEIFVIEEEEKVDLARICPLKWRKLKPQPNLNHPHQRSWPR